MHTVEDPGGGKSLSTDQCVTIVTERFGSLLTLNIENRVRIDAEKFISKNNKIFTYLCVYIFCVKCIE